jgi:hypothetical protein
VTDEKPQHFFLTYDNSGTVETDGIASGWPTSTPTCSKRRGVRRSRTPRLPDVWLDHPDGVKVDVYSVAFRKPFYSIGDSLDVIYAELFGQRAEQRACPRQPLRHRRQGEVLALRWNHFFRAGANTAPA